MIDLEKYQEFVQAVTSDASNDINQFALRCSELSNNSLNVNVPLLITACMGLAAECGEFAEIPKKILFQGKPLTEENVFHMKRELGDVIFYWINACRALNLDPNDVVAENIRKLEARYPGGKFDAERSNNRKKDDI